jgi:hypothetical protein
MNERFDKLFESQNIVIENKKVPLNTIIDQVQNQLNQIKNRQYEKLTQENKSIKKINSKKLEPVHKKLKIGALGGLYYKTPNGNTVYINKKRKQTWMKGRNFKKCGFDYKSLSESEKEILSKPYKERYKYYLPPKTKSESYVSKDNINFEVDDDKKYYLLND